MSKKPSQPVKIPKPRGGARPGGGRPKGSVSTRTLALNAVRDNAIQKGRTPLDVMLRNMRFYDEKAESAMKWVEEKMQAKKTTPLEVLELLKEMSEYRMQAQKCAVDCAPFVHPKLSAIAVKVDNEPIKAKEEGSMTPDELADYYNKLRSRPTSDIPLVVTIDNETGDVVDDTNFAEAAE